MTHVYYHGTSAEAGRKILMEGFREAEKIWNCSFPNHLYVWNGEKIEDDLYQPFESAQLAAAKSASKENHVYIFKIEVEEEFDCTVEDISCENMDAARSFDIDELNALLDDGRARLSYQIIEQAYYPEFRFAYMIYLKEEYLDFTKEEEELLAIAKRIYSESVFEELILSDNIDPDIWINSGFLEDPNKPGNRFFVCILIVEVYYE